MRSSFLSILLGLSLGLAAAQAQFNALNPAPVKIMPLGDSITKGAVDPEPSKSGYRARLFDLLTAAHVPFQFVGCTDINSNAAMFAAGQQFHNGYGSWRMDSLRKNLDGVSQQDGDGNAGGFWLTGHPGNGRGPVFPDIVLLLGGTNDLGQQVAEPELEKRMTELLTWFQKNRPKAEIYVATVPPRGLDKPGFETYNPAVVTFNSWLAAAVPRFGLHDHLVDFYALFVNKAGTVKMSDSPDGIYLTDGIHPSHNGYVAMGDAWFAAMKPRLKLR